MYRHLINPRSSAALGRQLGTNAVTSCLVSRLPADLMQGNVSFSLFARSHVSGDRVALSLECPFHEVSVLEVGIHSEKEIYAATLAAGRPANSTKQIGYNVWTHIAVVWNILGRTLSLFTNGRPSAVTVLDKAEVISFVKTIKEWRLVLGRGKSSGKMRDGWDGEVNFVSTINCARY